MSVFTSVSFALLMTASPMPRVQPLEVGADGEPIPQVERAPPATETPALIAAGVAGVLGLASLLTATYASTQYFGVCLDTARSPRESLGACNASTPLFAASASMGGGAFVAGATSLSLLAVAE